MHLGTRVLYLRRASGWTQLELATRAGISLRTLTEIELSETANPRLATVKSVAAALGVPVSDLPAESVIVDHNPGHLGVTSKVPS